MNSIISRVQQFIPSMDHARHKGEMGRIGVFGGSKEYAILNIYENNTYLDILVRPILPELLHCIA